MAKPSTPPGAKSKAPTAVTLSNVIVSENSEGAVIGKINVADPNKDDTFTLTVSDSRFEIVLDAKGKYQLVLKDGVFLDYELESSIALSVTATDNTGLSKTQQFTLAVTNINDAPVITADQPTASLIEATASNAGIQTSVVTLHKSDQDGTTPAYDLTGWIAQADGTFKKEGIYGDAVLNVGTGTVTYTLDNSRPATDDLKSTDHVIDVFSVGVSDGSLTASTDLSFAINGSDDNLQPRLIKLTDAPHGTRDSTFSIWNPDGTKLVLSSTLTLTADDTTGTGRGDNDLFAIDLATGERKLLTGTVAGGFEGYSGEEGWSPDGSKLLIATSSTLTAGDADGSNTDLYLIDVATGAKTWLTQAIDGSYDGQSYSSYWSPDGTKLYVLSTSNLTADDTDGANDAFDLFSIELATGQKTLLSASVDGGTEDNSYLDRWTPDGTKIIMQSGSTLTADDTDAGSSYDLYLLEPSTGERTLLTKAVPGGFDDGYSSVAGWSPDGTKMLVYSGSNLTVDDLDGTNPNADLFLIDIATGARTLLTTTAAGAFEGESSFVEWSPDGTKVLVRSTSHLTADDNDGLYFGTPDLFIIDVATGEKTLLTASVADGYEGYSASFGWSPDGTKAMVVSTSNLTADDSDGAQTNYDLFAIDISTGEKTLLTASVTGGYEGMNQLSGWSADGSKAIVLSTANLTADDADGDNFNWDLFSIDMATGEKSLLTAPVAGGIQGSSTIVGWSPDHTKMLVQSNSTLTDDDTDNGRHSVYAIDVATGEKQLLGDNFVYDVTKNWEPLWSSDGQSIQTVTGLSLSPGDNDDGGIDLYSIGLGSGTATFTDLGLDAISNASTLAEAGANATLFEVQVGRMTDYYLLA